MHVSKNSYSCLQCLEIKDENYVEHLKRKKYCNRENILATVTPLLKGQCHEMDILLLSFYLLLWNYLLIFKMPTESFLRIPFSVIARCSLVPTYRWLQST